MGNYTGVMDNFGEKSSEIFAEVVKKLSELGLNLGETPTKILALIILGIGLWASLKFAQGIMKIILVILIVLFIVSIGYTIIS